MNNQKKILIIANGIIGENPGLSGGDMRFLKIVKYWQEKGHEIHLLSSDSAENICKQFGINARLHILHGTRGSERFSYVVRFFQTLFFLPKSLGGLDDFIAYSVNDSLFDVIPGLWLKLRKRIKWVVVVHWLPPFPPWRRKKARVLNAILFFINERLSVWIASRFADTLLAVSQSTSQQLLRVGANSKKIYTVGCGVDFDDAHQAAQLTKKKKYDAIFMKRTQNVKGVFDLVEIWKRVVKEKGDARLLIAGGDGKDEELVKEAFCRAGLFHSVDFAGYIFDSKEKYRRLAESKLMILPSYEENWAIIIGESFAAGTPSVAYDLKELVDVWGDNVFWVSLGRVDLFSRKILSLLNAEQEVERMRDKNFKFIQEYSWESIALREEQIITR